MMPSTVRANVVSGLYLLMAVFAFALVVTG